MKAVAIVEELTDQRRVRGQGEQECQRDQNLEQCLLVSMVVLNTYIGRLS